MKKCTFLIVFIAACFKITAQDFKIESGQLVLPAPILFETGSDKIKPESEATLTYIKQFLDAKTYISTLRIEGHTDNSSNAATSQLLTEKRALAIVHWLVSKGVDCKRLLAVGFGDTKPVAANNTPDGKAQNRRIEVRMAGLRGKAIGGMPLDGGGKVSGDACQ